MGNIRWLGFTLCSRLVLLANHGSIMALLLSFHAKFNTLGIGSWRSISPGDWLSYAYHATGVFLDGSLHWLACESDNSVWISTFDLETEVFGTGSSPGLEGGHDFEGLLMSMR